MSNQAGIAVYLTRDLFLASRAAGVAGGLGVRLDVEGDPQQARLRASNENCRLLILDLSLPGLIPSDLMAALPDEDRPRVVAYDAHVNTQRLDAARKAGCDDVLTRGQFTSRLPELLQPLVND